MTNINRLSAIVIRSLCIINMPFDAHLDIELPGYNTTADRQRIPILNRRHAKENMLPVKKCIEPDVYMEYIDVSRHRLTHAPLSKATLLDDEWIKSKSGRKYLANIDGYLSAKCIFNHKKSGKPLSPLCNIPQSDTARCNRDQFTTKPKITTTPFAKGKDESLDAKKTSSMMPVYSDVRFNRKNNDVFANPGSEMTLDRVNSGNEYRQFSKCNVMKDGSVFVTPRSMDYSYEIMDPILKELSDAVERKEINSGELINISNSRAKMLLSEGVHTSSDGTYAFVPLMRLMHVTLSCCILRGYDPPTKHMKNKTRDYWRLPMTVYNEYLNQCATLIVDYVLPKVPQLHVVVSRFSREPLAKDFTDDYVEFRMELGIDYKRILLREGNE